MQRILDQLQRPPDAAALRDVVLTELMEATDATCAGGHGLVWDDNGRLRISDVHGVGDAEFEKDMLDLRGMPYDTFLPDEADFVEITVPFEAFVLVQRDELPASFRDNLWAPMKMLSGISINVQSNGRFVHNVIAIRKDGAPPFTERELALAKPWKDTITSVMRTASALDTSSKGEDAAFLLELDGAPRMAGGHTACWDESDLGARVQDCVREMLAAGEARKETFVGDKLVNLLVLRGAGDEAVLANISPVLPWRLPAVLQLPPATRRVVAMATRGATLNEIAADLERSPETVRSHLKRAYEALGVGSRAELTNAVRSIHRFDEDDRDHPPA